MMVFLYTSHGKQALQTAREKNIPRIYLVKNTPCIVKRQVSLSLESKNVTAIKSSCWRLFMVINILTLFRLQNLQNPNANSKARPKQVKTTSSETQQRRGKGRTQNSLLPHSGKSSLFLQNQPIPTSLPLLRTLHMSKCLTALPAWGTAAGATLSSLVHQSHNQ